MVDPSRSLTRKEFDEVIRRAAEIAVSEPDGGDSGLTESELFRIAQDVGLDQRHVRKALAEVRSSPPTARGLVIQLYGPNFVARFRQLAGYAEYCW